MRFYVGKPFLINKFCIFLSGFIFMFILNFQGVRETVLKTVQDLELEIRDEEEDEKEQEEEVQVDELPEETSRESPLPGESNNRIVSHRQRRGRFSLVENLQAKHRRLQSRQKSQLGTINEDQPDSRGNQTVDINEVKIAPQETERNIEHSNSPEEKPYKKKRCPLCCYKIPYYYNAPVVIYINTIIWHMLFLGLYSYVIITQFEQETIAYVEMILAFWVVNVFLEEIKQVSCPFFLQNFFQFYGKFSVYFIN